MKLLHSKSAAEPILAVTACPCANLFGLVTQSAVTVYRSTTLTTVFTFSLKPFQPPETAAPNAVRCCWSPSGRLFTLATAAGRILVLDVEGGALVRLLEPATADTAAAAASSGASASASPAPSSTPPAGVPRVPTTLPAGRSVLAMGWCAVPSMDAGRLKAMHADVHAGCLPVRTGATAALLDEAVQGGAVALPSNSDGADYAGAAGVVVGGGGGHAAGDAGGGTTSVSLLLVLGVDGVLRCLVGGLYEVHRVALAAPAALWGAASGHGSAWEGVCVEDMHVRQCAVTPDGEVASSDDLAVTADWSWCFGATAADGVRPAVAQHHRLYLTVHTLTTTQPQQQHPLTVSQSLCEVDLREHLAALATPRWLATCYVREYTRMAREVYAAAARDWHAVLRGRLWVHLDFPAAAPLITSAMLAQLTDPDPIALYKYAKYHLQRAAAVEDLEVLATTLQRVVAEVTHVCYRCCEAAQAYAGHLDASHDRHAAPRWRHLGDLRRELDAFVRRAAREAETVRDVALWVLQQSQHWGRGARFAMDGDAYAASRGRSPSPEPPSTILDEAPLSATRQPALLQYLSTVLTQHSSSHNTAAAAAAGGSLDVDEVLRLCAAVEACAAPSCAADESAAAAATRVVVGAAVGQTSATVAQAGAQLLSCVVTGVEETIGDGGVATSASGASDGGSAEEDERSANGDTAGTTRDAVVACTADEDGAACGYHPHYETGLEDAGVACDAAAVTDAALCCGVARGAVATEKASLYALRYAPDAAASAEAAALTPTQLTAYQLCVRHDASAATSASVAELCTAADVDGSLIVPRIKAAGTPHRISGGGLRAAYVPTWYGLLEEDRHVLVCQPAVVGGTAASPTAVAPFFIAVVDDDGRLVTVPDDGDDDDGADSDGTDRDGDAPAEGREGGSDAHAVRAVALCEVAGMEGVPLRVSMSRARSFCVVVGVTKYVVLSLYDDDY